jgi:hypothetical protein
VANGADRDDEELTLTLTRREFKELIETLFKAEELSTSARQHELDFRMQRMRFERKLRESWAPSPVDKRALERADTKFISLDELAALQKTAGLKEEP